MRAINHALTGAFIGLAISEPAVAIPVAVASHFVCDAIPHHGDGGDEKIKLKWLRSKLFRRLIYADAALCGLLVLILADKHPAHWLLAATCAFAATAPDFLSINRYRTALAYKHWKPGLYTAFAGKIQWFERPIGIVVEIAWFAAGLLILAPFMR